jgi:hypothetical protein
LLSGGLGGLSCPELTVGFQARGPGFVGIGFGVLAALGLAGQFGPGISDLPGGLGLDGLQLRLGGFGVSGVFQLGQRPGQLVQQGPDISADAVTQLRGTGGAVAMVTGRPRSSGWAAGRLLSRVASCRRRNAVSAVCGRPVTGSGWLQYFGGAPAPSRAVRGWFGHSG